MNNTLKVYFAHPINVYNTDLEARLIERITFTPELSKCVLENPNTEAHTRAYEARKQTTTDPMVYFEEVVATCNALVFLAFPDGKISGGVWREILAGSRDKLSLFEIFPSGQIWHISYAALYPPTRPLSREDTIARVRYPDGSPRPF